MYEILLKIQKLKYIYVILTIIINEFILKL